MSKTAKVESVSFTNEVGQTIQPGEEVIYATHSTGFLGISTGKYVGRLPSGRVRVEKTFPVKVSFKKGTDVKFDFYRDFLDSAENTIQFPKSSPSLRFDSVAWDSYNQTCNDLRVQRQKLFDSLVEYREEMHVKKTTLIANRIFKHLP